MHMWQLLSTFLWIQLPSTGSQNLQALWPGYIFCSLYLSIFKFMSLCKHHLCADKKWKYDRINLMGLIEPSKHFMIEWPHNLLKVERPYKNLFKSFLYRWEMNESRSTYKQRFILVITTSLEKQGCLCEHTDYCC